MCRLMFQLMVVMLVTLSAPILWAQTSPAPETISLDLTMVPIDSALKILFDGKGLNYTLDSNVRGIVKEVHLKGIGFDTALKTLLKQVDPPLVYRKEGTVYLVSVKPEVPKLEVEPLPEGPNPADAIKETDMILEKISLNFLDAYELAAMIQGGTNANTNANTNNSRGYNNTNFGGGNFGGGMNSFGGGFGGNMGGGYGNSTGGNNFGGSFGGNNYGSGSGWGGNNQNSYGTGNTGNYGSTGGGFGIRSGGTTTTR